MEPAELNNNDKRSNERSKKRPPKETSNPLIDGISRFLRSHAEENLHAEHDDTAAVTTALPKRYTIYKPLLLLPASVFTSPPAWAQLYASLNETERQRLYESIASSFQPLGVTHVALNAPIELTNSNTGTENRMRSPVGLVPLYGDFGPIFDPGKTTPDNKNLEEAFWVQTAQNGGIVQCWAPVYTMFSRGNVTEKARILGLGNRFDGLDASSLGGQRVGEISVVDLYAGIGYFSFSYLKRGVKRVWGWELNGWSVEGLRRGCLKNGWGCKVIPLDVSGALRDVAYETVVDELTDDDRIVLFHGDNRLAAEIMGNIQPLLLQRSHGGAWAPVRHVNLGLLPSSQPTWDSSLKLLDRKYGGWTHVHENVDINEIDVKKGEIVAEYEMLGSSLSGQDLNITCDHVEKVKTYAPGVMHCVYDIHVNPL